MKGALDNLMQRRGRRRAHVRRPLPPKRPRPSKVRFSPPLPPPRGPLPFTPLLTIKEQIAWKRKQEELRHRRQAPAFYATSNTVCLHPHTLFDTSRFCRWCGVRLSWNDAPLYSTI